VTASARILGSSSSTYFHFAVVNGYTTPSYMVHAQIVQINAEEIMARENEKGVAEVLRQWLEDRDRGPKETVNGRGRVVRIVGVGGRVRLGCVWGVRLEGCMRSRVSTTG